MEVNANAGIGVLEETMSVKDTRPKVVGRGNVTSNVEVFSNVAISTETESSSFSFPLIFPDLLLLKIYVLLFR